MMPTHVELDELLKELSRHGMEFWKDGERLRYRVAEDVLTPELLDTIKQHKSEILDILRDGDPPVGFYPLSYGQQALWYIYQSAPQSSSYNIGFTARIRSSVTIPALQQAFQAVVNRHSCLRTQFQTINGQPFQKIIESQAVCFADTNVADWTDDAIKQHITMTSQKPFDLVQGPLFQTELFTRNKDDHILLVKVHHIIFDGWSLWLLLHDLQTAYAEEITGLSSSLTPLKATYADYVRKEAEILAGSDGETLWTYWREQLSGDLPVINLPTDHPRPPIQTFNGATVSFTLREMLAGQLRALAQSQGATLYMVFLAAFNILLHRYTHQTDLLVGTPNMGRTHPEFEGVIGYFLNMLALRINVSEDPSFEDFLAQVRQTVLRALEHQNYPFPVLVEKLQIPRDTSRSPVFQVVFNVLLKKSLEIFTEDHQKEPDRLILKPYEIPQEEGQFDLTVELIETRQTIGGFFKYNTDLFDAETITAMTGHFQTLLQGIVEHPQQCLSEFPILTEAEQSRILEDWNATAAGYPSDRSVHELFELQAERHPQRIALDFQGQKISYRQLNQRANNVAHHLLAHGVKPGMLIGVCIERSPDMIVSLLAILKAGGAYVPLDPTYPDARLLFITQDADMGAIITQEQFASRFPADSLTIVEIDGHDWTGMNTPNLARQGDAEDLAYVTYTSGSTGKPKGVQISHRAVVNFLCSMQRSPGFDEQDVLLAVTTISFDIAGLELFLPLIAGGQIILASQAQITDGPALLAEIRRSHVTIMQATPVTWQLLIEAGWDKNDALTVLCGGEALSPQLARQLTQRSSAVWNMYGPTETTIWSTLKKIDPDQSRITIGHPIANTQVYILDSTLQPVPRGVVGELHIGGDGLSKGYWKQPELTRDKFIPHPFSHDADARLYKTGDLARYLPDGDIECLGRVDFQVKVRGFRIELGEIESILVRHPGVKEAVVTALEGLSGDTRLVAYIIQTNENGTLSPLELRDFLKTHVTDYMLPSAFMFMQTFPLTPNGKIDRQALPAPDHSGMLSEHQYVAPRNANERIIAEMWAEMLAVERVGINDDFFELGGHSILSAQLVGRIRQHFHVEVPLRDFIKQPTVAGLRQAIQHHVTATRHTEPIQPASRATDIPLSFGQEQMWILSQIDTQNIAYNMPAALRLTGKLNLSALERSLAEIIRRHETLRTTFPVKDGKPIQFIAPPQPLSVPVADMQRFSEEQQHAELEHAMAVETRRPFDLSTGPLFRANVMKLDETIHVLLIVFHHSIFDGWSIAVFIHEFVELYAAFSNDKISPLPELPIQYADFACWQRQYLQADTLDRLLTYWTRTLSGELPPLNFPADHPRQPQTGFNGAVYRFRCSAMLAESLKALCQQEKATLFMALLTGFNILLNRYTNQDDLIVGVPFANRNRPELESLIGYFVNPLPLRVDLSGDPTIRELLRDVQKTVQQAQAHQELPFEQIVSALQIPRESGQNPVFQTMFAWQNMPTSKLELPGVSLSPITVHNNTAKFDLLLEMEETDDGLSGTWEYNSALFEPATIQRISRHFERILEAMDTNPEQHIAQIPLLTETEQRQILVDWNDTAVTFSDEYTVPQLFEACAARDPERIALVFKAEQMTYGELNRRANQVAHYLQSLGVGPETLVGICLERSVEMIVGVLGILKAGGAYLPLDPHYPPERLEFMLNDAAPPLMLTQADLLAQLPEQRPRTICLDWDWGIISQCCNKNPHNCVTLGNLAYVIYTSGSTGKPKGVMVTHRGIPNLGDVEKQVLGLQVKSRVLQFSSIGFDASVWEIFATFLAGATLYLAPKEESLQDVLQKYAITVVTLPPSALMTLSPEKVPELQTIVSAGEACTADIIERWTPGRRFINAYGPTEATVCATINEHIDAQRPVSIGKAIANAQIYIVDDNLSPVPVGVPGELCIGGIGLARGYLNRPDLTDEKFIPHPFREQSGERLYRTGDLARYLPDGNIEFLGRIDHQVKVRGFRIELGEIETVLTTHTAVKEAIVLAREDQPDNKRLVAYVVPEPDCALAISELRNLLKGKLPDYMLPSAFVLLEALPLNPNGKIDRRALPAPDKSGLEKQYVAPRTPTEERLAAIWAEVLNTHQVGMTDDFFEIGGHSLLATQVVSRIRADFHLEIPLSDIFQDPTIAGLATLIEAIHLAQESHTSEEIQNGDEEEGEI